MHLKCCEFLKVDNGSYISTEICFVKCKLFQGDNITVTRRWFERKHGKEAVGLYRAVRDDPVQCDQLVKSQEATVRHSGPLKIAYVFKSASEGRPLVLEPRSEVADWPLRPGGQFRSLYTSDVILACSVALIGADGEEAGLGQLARPIGASTQPTVSSYFKPVSSA
ncbi:uncharacterized protein LOC122382634 isoform X2 [Amphibalanus amphitrite]|uniref:uncharacterized protein LOC122382634 isoform X2 n=1 Tax=Amphibalanus amphitrite TaxID=1232801 RepID=UPI001C92510A|nr:uncharacterized protein LOC122382634 isoform X2 [Amphibalanus amphitrite]